MAQTDQRRTRWVAAVVPGIAMLSIAAWGLNRGSMWQDESASFDVAHRTTSQILMMVRHVDIVHAVYYLLLHLWMLPGGGEVWMRVPSVVAATLAAVMVGAIGARLAAPWVGLFAGLLFAATPLVSFYAQEGRSSSLVCATVLFATYCLVRAAEDPSRIWRAGYVAAMVLAVALHEFAVLALAAHAATLALSGTLRRVWRWWAPGVGAVALVVAPIADLSVRQSGQVGWLSPPTWATLAELAHQFLGTSLWAMFAVAGLVVVGLTGLRRGAGRISLVSLGLPLVAIPPLVLLLGSQIEPLYHVRYVLFAVAGVPFLAASGLQRFSGQRVADRPLVAGLVAVVLAGSIFAAQLPTQQFDRTPASRNDDLAAAAAVIGGQARYGDAVVFLPRRFRAAALAYPDAFAAVHDVALRRSPIEASNLRGVDWGLTQTRTRLASYRRVWVIGRPHLTVRPGERAALDVSQLLQQDFTCRQIRAAHGLEVALCVRGTVRR
jgi:mannosyltransferase